MNQSATQRTCPDCGLDYVPKGRGHGCPHCLLRLAMPEGEPSDLGQDPPPPFGLRSRYFAGHEILGEIARGGMGVVYRARQLNLNREVALKMIQAMHLVSLEARLRFKVEIEAVAPLNHPNIVSLYESGEQDGIHYFTMRLVEGGNLGDYLQQDHPLKEKIRLLIKVCHTVHYAHQRGILHRDLKPSNILVDLQGEPLVADFGLAKSLDHETAFTYSHSILGSPNYMAPEQATSHSGPVSTAVDVYGLGAILYHMLTGRPPFQGKTALETIRQVVDDPPAPPRRLNPQIDADLATICLKALEKNPAHRYESAEALAHDLEHWQTGMPIRARPVGALGTAWRWARRHPAVSSLSAALAVAALAFLIGIPIALLRIREAQRQTVAHLQTSLLDQARMLRLSNPMGVRSESLRLIQQAVDHGPGTSAFRDRARDELLGTLAITDLAFSPQASLPSGDPDLSLLDPALSRLAFITERTNLVLRRLADGTNLLQIATGDAPVVRVESFSPDGRHLALRHTNGLSFWNTETGARGFATNGPNRVFTFASHAPLLFLEEWGYGVTILALPDFRVVQRLQVSPDSPTGPNRGWTRFSVSPDGAWLAGARSFDNILELIDLKSGRTLWQQPNDSPVTCLAWQPLYRRLIAASADGVARLRLMENGDVNAVLTLGGPVHHIALDSSNVLLASAGEDRVVRLWNLVAYRQASQFPCDARQLWFDASGQKLGSVQRGPQVGWLDLARTREFQEMVLAGSRFDIERCAFNGDGRLAIGGLSGQIELRRVRDGRYLHQFPVQRMPIFAMDPLGAGIVTSDSRGVAYHPMKESPPGQIHIQNPAMIVHGPRWRSVAFSADGQRFFAANGLSNTVYVFDRTLTNCLTTIGPHEGVDLLATTRDGTLVASGSTGQREARVWNIASHSQELSAPITLRSQIALSPDGRWFLVHGESFHLYDLHDDQPPPPLPFAQDRPLLGAACFSQDSRVLAVVIDQHEIQLFDLASWKALGRLRGPREVRMNALAFNHDGSRIAAACTQGRLRIWNLSLMRQTLAAFNLDWIDSPFPGVSESTPPDTVPVEIFTGR